MLVAADVAYRRAPQRVCVAADSSTSTRVTTRLQGGQRQYRCLTHLFQLFLDTVLNACVRSGWRGCSVAHELRHCCASLHAEASTAAAASGAGIAQTAAEKSDLFVDQPFPIQL